MSSAKSISHYNLNAKDNRNKNLHYMHNAKKEAIEIGNILYSNYMHNKTGIKYISTHHEVCLYLLLAHHCQEDDVGVCVPCWPSLWYLKEELPRMPAHQ